MLPDGGDADRRATRAPGTDDRDELKPVGSEVCTYMSDTLAGNNRRDADGTGEKQGNTRRRCDYRVRDVRSRRRGERAYVREYLYFEGIGAVADQSERRVASRHSSSGPSDAH